MKKQTKNTIPLPVDYISDMSIVAKALGIPFKKETRGRKFKGYVTLYKKVPESLKAELAVYVDQKVKEYEDAKKSIG